MVPGALYFDMRSPDFGAPASALYAAAVEQCAWADALGFHSVAVSEHHASSDGYLPSPTVLAAAIAAATERLAVRLSVILLPLYHPLRAAEDLAVLDLITGGRLELVVGAGYRAEEYEQFGLDIRRRPSLMEHAIETVKRAWTGEPFSYDGRTVTVLPRPFQRPRPSIVLGGASPASAKRAARIADDYRPLSAELYEVFVEERERLGKRAPAPDPTLSWSMGDFVHVWEDTDEGWSELAPHILHEVNDYARWGAAAQGGKYRETTSIDELKALGRHRVVTPDECLRIAEEAGGVRFHPLVGGFDPELAWRSLRLFERDVLPELP